MIEKTAYKAGGAGCGACILKHNTLTVTGEHEKSDVIAAMKTGKFSAEVMVE